MDMDPTVPASRLPSFDFDRWHRRALNPWTVVLALILGIALALLAPQAARRLSVVGTVYIDLLKMVVLPYMLSAVIFSLQNLLREGSAGRIATRVAWVFVAAATAAALLAAAVAGVIDPGAFLSGATRDSLGEIVERSALEGQSSLRRYDGVNAMPGSSVRDIIAALVPSNIFAALASGETLKALVFALLFGAAVAGVPSRISDGMNQTLETVYRTCHTLLRWISLLLPLALVSVTASQVAVAGLGPLRAMGAFVLVLGLACAMAIGLSLWLLRLRSQRPLGEVVSAMREPLALAVATASPAVCMPAMIEALAGRLNFARARVELLVPLAASLLAVGTIIYVTCATLFVADLYGRTLGPADIALVIVLSALAGFASVGMTGLVILSLVTSVTSYLALPFEAAFVLFAAVDPLCAMARSAATVIGASAAVAATCPRPLTLED